MGTHSNTTITARRKGVEVLFAVDAADADLASVCWQVDKDGYARRASKRINGRRPCELLHRTILARKLGRALFPGEIADHENGDVTNCHRSNLRPTDALGNSQNLQRGNRRNRAGGLRGVYWHKRSGKWGAAVRVNGRTNHYGLFINPAAAAARAAEVRSQLGFLGATP